MAAIKLFYFDSAGRGELIRLVLAWAGVEFEDIRFKGDDWPSKYKAEAPFGQAPFIEYNGKKYGQSAAIANFFAREYGLHGEDNLEGLRIEEVIGLVQDFFAILIRIFLEQDPDKKEEIKSKMVKEDAPRFYGFFLKLLQENGTGFFVGERLTLADLVVFDLTSQLNKTFGFDACAEFPEIKTLVTNVESNANIKKYLDSRK